MKRSEILGLVQAAIADRPNPGPHKYYIYWKRDHVACEPAYCTPPPEILFAVFRNETLALGLTPAEWDQLEKHIATFLIGKGIV